MEEQNPKLEMLASLSLPSNQHLVYIVDFLNKNLKQKRIMFGLTKDKAKDEMTIKIYEF